MGSPELVQATSRSGLCCTPSGRSVTPGAGVVAQPGPQGVGVVLGQVDGRHAVEVGRDLAAAGVDEHHADAVGTQHRVGLVDPADLAALAHDDPARHQSRVEAPGDAQRDCDGLEPAAATRAPSTRRAGRVARRAAMAPRSRSPGATTAPCRVTPVVPPTEVTHGEAWAAYWRVPRLPDAATTTMSASAAPSRARSRVSTVAMPSSGPSTERLSTSTRSATARSTAVTRSAAEQPSSRGSGAVQQAL